MSQFMVLSMPVIINDTGDWDGEIKADERGFLVFDNAMWVQTGANYKDEYIFSFLNDFSPLITASGINNVMCVYHDIGWIWPTSGRNASDQLSFRTSNLVYAIELIADEEEFTIDNGSSIGSIGSSPASANYTVSYSITTSTTTNTTYGLSLTGQNSINFEGTLLRIISLGHSISSAVTVGITRLIGQTNEQSYSNTIGLSTGPIEFNSNSESASVRVYMVAYDKIYNIHYFDDSDSDGLCNESNASNVDIKHCYNPVPGLKIVIVPKARSSE